MSEPILKFTVSEELRLIDLIRKHPELYDANHALAKDNSHKKVVWGFIAVELNTSVETLKKTWKKLHYQYMRRSRNHDPEKRIKSTQCDEALAFLLTSALEHSSTTSSKSSSPISAEFRSLQSGSHLSAISEEEKPIVATNDLTSTAQEKNAHNSNEQTCSPPLQNTDTVPGSGASERIDKSIDRVPRPRLSEPSPLASKESLQKAVNTSPRRLTMTPKRNQKFPNPDDPTSAFFKSMALTVATFPQHLQANMKIQVCNIVAETEYELTSPKIR